jgi:hypothetical protein
MQLLILCPMAFVAGFIDSIAGGGGLISVPAYLLTGIPAHMAVGTNKLSASFATLTATVKYAAGKKIHYASALCAVPAALAASFLGARATLFFDDRTLRIILLVILPFVAAFTIWKKRLYEEDRLDRLTPKTLALLSAILGGVVGFYDGFFGPGTGMFLTLGFSALGFSAVKSAGNARLVNLASGMAALVSFILSGNVNFGLGLPAMVFGMTGSFLGSHFALRLGVKLIRPVLIVVVALLFGTMLYNLF